MPVQSAFSSVTIMSEPQCVVCSRKAPLTCSACKAISYCSKDHQKHHWPEHKNNCRPFEVKVNKELGRHLVAKRSLKAGDILYEENPTVVGPKIVEPTPVCLGCLRAPGAACCDKCGWPICNPLCPGLRDPHCHATECKILSLSPISDIKECRYECILPLRCLLMQKRNPRKWKIIMSMETHFDKRGPSTEVYKELDENVVKYLIDNYLSKLNDSVLDDMSSEIIHRICGAIDVNALEIHEDQTELLALLPTAFIMCHSCTPNTKHTFKNTRITVRASVDIARGEDITTMYTHMLWTTQARREHLLNTKYFSCQCPRCADPTELGTSISALRCLAETPLGTVCGGYQYPKDPLNNNCTWACEKCSEALTSQEVCQLISCLDIEVENIQLIYAFANNCCFIYLCLLYILAMYYLGLYLDSGTTESEQKTPFDDKYPTVERLNDLLGKLETVLHPHHYLCYKIKHSLIQLYGHQTGFLHPDLNDQALSRKTTICYELISVTNKIDPGHGRLGLYSAVLHHELHAALMELYSRKKDKKLVEKAKAVLDEEIRFLPSFENDYSPEYRMRELAKRALIDVNKILLDYSSKKVTK